MEVVECSATDLIGSYVGHTGPKTLKQLERGLGKVLLIDEAYRLGEGQFAQEAVNELVDLVTKPKFAGKLVIILAGYDNDMNKLFQVKEGLSSRFADEFIFPALSPENCLRLLETKLKQSTITIPSLKTASMYQELLDPMTELSTLPAWGSARDVETLARSMVRSVFQNTTSKVDQLTVTRDTALRCINDMLLGRRSRNKTASVTASPFPNLPQQVLDQSRSLPGFGSNADSASKPAPPPAQANVEEIDTPLSPVDTTRDPGVSDAI